MFFTGLSKFFQILINLVGATLSILVSFFPSSPFQLVFDSQFATLLQNINYFIPIAEFVAITQAWTVVIALFYVYSVYARFLKAVQ